MHRWRGVQMYLGSTRLTNYRRAIINDAALIETVPRTWWNVRSMWALGECSLVYYRNEHWHCVDIVLPPGARGKKPRVVTRRTRWSQAARRGVAVFMASAVVVLKHETSTLRPSHNFISIGLKFGVSATLPSLVNIVSAVAPSRGGEIYGSRAFYYFCFCFYISWHAYSLYPWTDFNVQ